MTPARIIVLIIAIVAGGFAALLAGRSDKPPAPVKVAAPVDTVGVLVARRDIPMGQKLTAEDMRWQAWPRDAASATFVRRSDKPQAIEAFGGAIARSSFVAGEPIREDKIIKSDGSGFLAAILPAGKRALSTEISPETGAGGFILPNDRVDVILTRRERGGEGRGGERANSEIILSDIRVLAIDQTVQEKDGQRVVVGRTATLEVSPGQAETLALARQLGTLSLALRSLADANKTANDEDDEHRRRSRREINMVRFGVATTSGQR